jgi:P4 family phage/plasmid primase-like protien
MGTDGSTTGGPRPNQLIKLTAPASQPQQAISTMAVDPYLSSALRSFVEDRRVTDKSHSAEWSMTGMGEKKGKWYICDEDYPKFLDLMHTYLFIKSYRPNNFVEQRKADGITPLLIDLDFRYPAERSLQRSFSTEHIHIFIQDVLSVLKDCFDVKDRPFLRFFVTLRPQPYNDPKPGKKEIKDGVHIVCPDFSITPDHHALVRWLLLQRDAVQKSFEGTGYINKDDDVYDKSLTKTNGWLFYGESKPSIPPYLLTHVFKYNTKSGKMAMEEPSIYESRTLMELLSIRYGRKPLLNVVESRREFVEQSLLELQGPPAPVAPVEQDRHAFGDELTGMLPIVMDSINHVVITEDDIELAKQLVECLNAERAESYDTWMRVGWCLRNIDSSTTMFDKWMEFSAKSSKSSGNNMEALRKDWIRGSMKRVSGAPMLLMGSLKRWAKEDDYEKYMSIIDKDIISFIQKVGVTFKGGTHHHVAQMIYKLFHDTYKCTIEGRTTEWYMFNEHIWNPMPQGVFMKSLMSDVISKKVDSARHSLRQPDSNDPDREMKMKIYNDNMTKLLKLQENLFNATFKESVMKEAVQLFYDPYFYKKINQNPYLLGCANGILHLREVVFDKDGNPLHYEPTLHPGTKDDYVTLKSGVTADGMEAIEYVPYEPTNPINAEMMDFFSKLFPSDELREYVLTLAAGCLEGANKEQNFYIMTGSGGNGKSKFVGLMLSVLGQYAGSLASTALTRKRPESGAANPDIMSIKGSRFVEVKEPDEGEPLNTARMKQFSGEDLVEARGLFKDQEKFKIMGKIFLACNKMPPIHSMDGGTWRRIRVIPFDSRFVPAGDPTLDPSKHVYPRDDMLEAKLLSWRVPFLSLLVHYYKTKYCPHGIKHVPAVVMQASENYKSSYDMFGKFIKSRVRRVGGWDDPPTLKTFIRVYKIWHQEQQTGKKLTDKDVEGRLNEMFQTPTDKNKSYPNLRLFETDEDIEEYDAELAAAAEAEA